MLGWSLKCVTGRSLEVSMNFDVLIDTTSNHMSFLSEIRERTVFGKWELVL